MRRFAALSCLLLVGAAPIPRLGSVCEESVWRVPKLTSVSTVAFIRAALTGATIARSFASGEVGGAPPTSNRHNKAANLRIGDSPFRL